MPRASTKVKTTTVEEKEIPAAVDLELGNEPMMQPMPPAQPIITFPDQGISQDEDDLKKFFEGLGGSEVIIKISKYDAASNRPRYLQDTDLEGASEAYIQTNWGEGRYLLRAYKEGTVIGSKTVHIGPPLQKNLPQSAAQPVFVSPPTTDPLISMQIEMMREESRLNRDLMLKMIEKIGGNEKSGATELAEVMAMLKPVLTPPAPTGGSALSLISEAIPLVKQLIELGASGGTEKKGWMDTVREIVPEVAGVLKSMSASRMPVQSVPTAPAPVAPYPGGTPVAIPAAPAALANIDPQQIQLIRSAIAFLKTRALRDADPNAFVGYVLNTLDDEQSMSIAKLLERPYDDIAVLDPELVTAVYRPWFEEFFGGLKDALSQRDSTGGQGGDSPDATPNAGSDNSGGAVRSTDPESRG